ncbi:MAG: collagen-like protein [Cytophagaceae bacterium]
MKKFSIFLSFLLLTSLILFNACRKDPVPGPQGPQGEEGPAGATGPQGQPGHDFFKQQGFVQANIKVFDWGEDEELEVTQEESFRYEYILSLENSEYSEDNYDYYYRQSAREAETSYYRLASDGTYSFMFSRYDKDDKNNLVSFYIPNYNTAEPENYSNSIQVAVNYNKLNNNSLFKLKVANHFGSPLSFYSTSQYDDPLYLISNLQFDEPSGRLTFDYELNVPSYGTGLNKPVEITGSVNVILHSVESTSSYGY